MTGVSPNSQLVSRRLDTLTRLASPVVEVGRPRIVVTTVAAITSGCQPQAASVPRSAPAGRRTRSTPTS